MSRPPVPIADLTRRLPEMGRVKIGVITEGTKNGRKYTRPKAIDTFRFTSQDPTALAQVAAELGGTVVPYHHDKSTDTHELITERNEVRIALPPDPLGGSPIYEEYTAGGRESCDGVTREKWRTGPEGPEPYEAPCECDKAGELACKVTTHLNVLLPFTRLSGTWRITTHSYNAALELPGMVDLIRSLQDRGLTRGILRIRHETQVLAGETRKFKVPTLGVDETAEALAAGAGMLGALPAAPVAQIEAGGAPALPAGHPSSPPRPERVTPDAVSPPQVAGGEGSPHESDGEGASTLTAPTPPGTYDLDDLLALVSGKTPGARKKAALMAARGVAERAGEPMPASFDEITGELAAATCAYLNGGPDDSGGGGGRKGDGEASSSDPGATEAPSPAAGSDDDTLPYRDVNRQGFDTAMAAVHAAAREVWPDLPADQVDHLLHVELADAGGGESFKTASMPQVVAVRHRLNELRRSAA